MDRPSRLRPASLPRHPQIDRRASVPGDRPAPGLRQRRAGQGRSTRSSSRCGSGSGSSPASTRPARSSSTTTASRWPASTTIVDALADGRPGDRRRLDGFLTKQTIARPAVAVYRGRTSRRAIGLVHRAAPQSSGRHRWPCDEEALAARRPSDRGRRSASSPPTCCGSTTRRSSTSRCSNGAGSSSRVLVESDVVRLGAVRPAADRLVGRLVAGAGLRRPDLQGGQQPLPARASRTPTGSISGDAAPLSGGTVGAVPQTALTPAIRDEIARLGRADIMVGIPSFKNAATIGYVVRAAQAGLVQYFPDLHPVARQRRRRLARRHRPRRRRDRAARLHRADPPRPARRTASSGSA